MGAVLYPFQRGAATRKGGKKPPLFRKDACTGSGWRHTMRNILVILLSALALSLPAAAKSASKDTGAQVTCKDGSTSKAGRGACSHHGGVGDVQAKAQAPAKAPQSGARVDNGDTGETGASKSGKSGGILGGLFGRRGDTAQARSSKTT